MTNRNKYLNFYFTYKLLYTVVAVWRLVGGKIVEGWIFYDQLDFLEQLGAVGHIGFPDESAL